jgi:hypothetical protein
MQQTSPTSPRSQTPPVENSEMKLVFQLGLQIGQIFGSLNGQKMQLESEQRTLNKQIEQLKAAHTVKLDVLIENWSAKRKVFVEHLKTIIVKLKSFSDDHRCCVLKPIDPSPVKKLLNAARKIDFEELRKYPEPTEKQPSLSQEKQVSLVSPIQTLAQMQPTVKDLVQPALIQVVQLEKETTHLRELSFALIQEK